MSGASARPRIALIHAVTMAMQPVTAALAALWPQARAQHLLDDALSPDREADGELTSAMRRRIVDLAAYAQRSGANGILYTCSAFGPAIDDARRAVPVPILKPNEAMFADALSRGGRIGMLATFAPSVPSMEAEFRAMARERGASATIESVCVPEAMQALRAGDGERHDRLLADAVDRLDPCDVLLLAHFSTSRALEAVSARTSVPVLTSPRSAVSALRRAIESSEESCDE